MHARHATGGHGGYVIYLVGTWHEQNLGLRLERSVFDFKMKFNCGDPAYHSLDCHCSLCIDFCVMTSVAAWFSWGQGGMVGGSVCAVELGYFRVPLTLSSTSTTLVMTQYKIRFETLIVFFRQVPPLDSPIHLLSKSKLYRRLLTLERTEFVHFSNLRDVTVFQYMQLQMRIRFRGLIPERFQRQ